VGLGRRVQGGVVNKIKFGDPERRQVIEAIEQLKNTKLTQIGNYKKFLQGSDRAYYCIVGGTADWHGIPKEIIQHAIKDSSNFYVAVARLLKAKIDLHGANKTVNRFQGSTNAKLPRRFPV
jgi:hypothetical protein